MKIPPDYTITPEILTLLSEIDSIHLYLSSLAIKPELLTSTRRSTLLKSSLYSARIEGNTLTEENFDISDEEREKREVFNIMEAAAYIEKSVQPDSSIDDTFVKSIHGIVMRDLRADAGSFRKEITAIFNQAGVAVYMTPSPEAARKYLHDLYDYIQSKNDEFPLVVAMLSHLMYEKIHPFVDGNGRIGRLLIAAVLQKRGYHKIFFVPLEEYLENHRDEYYYHLDKGLVDTQGYLTFMLGAYREEIQKLKSRVETDMNKKILIPPRQEEIYAIIKDHSMVSFDFLQRRFLKVPARTLRFDLKKLCEKELVTKVGKTRGSFYTASK